MALSAGPVVMNVPSIRSGTAAVWVAVWRGWPVQREWWVRPELGGTGAAASVAGSSALPDHTTRTHYAGRARRRPRVGPVGPATAGAPEPAVRGPGGSSAVRVVLCGRTL